MEELKEKAGKEVELLSEEAQEVMNRIPSSFVRWGMTIMVIILAGLLIASAYFRWPQTIKCPFEGRQIGEIIELKTTLTPETLNYLLHVDEHAICVYSPMLQQNYDSDGIIGKITKISTYSYSSNQYNTTLTVIPNQNILTPDSILYGDIQLIISEKTLLQSIIEKVQRW